MNEGEEDQTGFDESDVWRLGRGCRVYPMGNGGLCSRLAARVSDSNLYGRNEF